MTLSIPLSFTCYRLKLIMSIKFNESTSFRQQSNENVEEEIVELKIPVINYSNMTEKITQICLKEAEKVLYDHYKGEIVLLRDMAQKIKQHLDDTVGGQWNAIVGKDFGSYVAFEKNCVIHFSINTFHFLIWRYA